MGRTTPPIRLVLDAEAEKLRKNLCVVRDPLVKKALEEAIQSYNDLVPFLALASPQLPVDSILLAALAKLWARVLELERKVASEGTSREGQVCSGMGR